ncbi:MAG: amidohydrolase family protein [Hyphomicrobiaceae bacterium]
MRARCVQLSNIPLARLLVVMCLSLALLSATTAAQDYDLVILNGRVIDPETGFDKVRNVGVKAGQVIAITADPIKGSETIDASGHVVAPGFVDGHVHTVDMPLGQKAALRDGVTTALDLEVGAHPVDRWYTHLKGRSQMNFGASASAVGARAAVFNPKYESNTGGTGFDMFFGKLPGPAYVIRRATEMQRKQILKHVETGLRQGALGIGPPVGYMTRGFSSEEMIGMQKLAAKYGRFMHVHTRFSSQVSPTSGLLAFQEAIDPAVTYGGGLIIAHFTAQSLRQTKLAMEYVDALRAKGFPIVLEVYPYNFGGAGNGIQADYLEPKNFQENMGRSYKDIIDVRTGRPLDQATYNKLVKEDPSHPVLFYNATVEDNLKGVEHPDVLIGCDCFPLTDAKTGKTVIDWDTPWDAVSGHPRTSGAHAKVLRLVRERKVDLTLMQAISKMSFQYAKFLQENGVAQMAFKGRMQVGADADITIFDPETVTDNSTLKTGENALPSTGIPYVVVNGTVVVKDSKVLKNVFPGEAIRAPVQF